MFIFSLNLPGRQGNSESWDSSSFTENQNLYMKIIHTADWHLGQTFFGYDRTEEHEAFLQWLSNKITELQIDALLICGDVFDVANPAAQAQKQFYRFLQKVTLQNPSLQIVVIAGNHDSAARLETPIPLLEEKNTYIRGMVNRSINGNICPDDFIIELKDREGKRQVWCMAVPYLRHGDYPVGEAEKDSYPAGVKRMYNFLWERIAGQRQPTEAVIALGHLQAAGSVLTEGDNSERLIIGGLEGIPADTFPVGLAYTALGHIHREQQIGRREEVRYAGSPLPMSFAEENYRHGVILLDIQEGQLRHWEKLPFEPPVRLLRIPRQPEPLSEVIGQLAALPATDPETPAPYLEVRVLLKNPEPSLRNRIEEAVADKQVRLTRVVPFYPSFQGTAPEDIALTSEELMDPLAMLRTVYERKFQEDIPSDLEKLFIEALQEAQQKSGKQA